MFPADTSRATADAYLTAHSRISPAIPTLHDFAAVSITA
jgi:hypothetical protein